jgi:hypothetical protein
MSFLLEHLRSIGRDTIDWVGRLPENAATLLPVPIVSLSMSPLVSNTTMHVVLHLQIEVYFRKAREVCKANGRAKQRR